MNPRGMQSEPLQQRELSSRHGADPLPCISLNSPILTGIPILSAAAGVNFVFHMTYVMF